MSQNTKIAIYKQEFSGSEIDQIVKRANKIMELLRVLPEYERKDRKGGILLLSDFSMGAYTALPIGEVPNADPKKYFDFALAKCTAIKFCDHANGTEAAQVGALVSSFMFRDEAKGIFAGGIHTEILYSANPDGYLIAFSGLPELADEALVLTLCTCMGWISQNEAGVVAKRSQNPFFESLFKAFCEHPTFLQY